MAVAAIAYILVESDFAPTVSVFVAPSRLSLSNQP